MEKLLKEIAGIRAGYSFRGTIPAQENGNYRVIQIKDIDYDGKVEAGELISAQVDYIKPAYLADAEDILFTARGANRRAAVVGRDTENAIFVSQIYALKVKSNAVIPEFLAWYLNQKPAQDFFEANASGSYIQNIAQSVLNDMPITVPPLETQKKIIKIFELSLREREIARKLTDKRWKLAENALLQLITE